MWTNDTPSRTATPAHRQWRRAVLERDGNRCQLAYDNRCTGHATEADHITEVADGGPEFDLTNGQAVCTPCHKHKTALHANRTRWSNRNLQPDEVHPALR